jgi:hypothetical protein
MDAEDPTSGGGYARLAAVFAAAALAIPGGMLVGDALAADGSSGAPNTTAVPIQQSEDPSSDRDCPEEEGSGESAAPSTGSQGTAL